MNLKKLRIVLGHLMVALLVLPGFVSGEMTDEQKLKAAYSMYADYKQEFPSVIDMSPKEAMTEAATGNIVFVDTRKAEEMEISTLPGAISEKEFLENRISYRDKKVVVYCTISYRSGLFARKMNEMGVPVYNLEGGIVTWVLEGGKVYNGERETKRVHVYGKKWNLLPKGYEAVMFGLLDKLRF